MVLLFQQNIEVSCELNKIKKPKNKNYESLGKKFYCQYKRKRKKHAVRAIGVMEDGEIGLNRLKNCLQLP